MSIIQLTWNKVNSNSANGYNVYRDGVRINNGVVGIDIENFSDSNAVISTEHRYVVKTVYDSGETIEEVDGSNVVRATGVLNTNALQYSLIWEHDFSNGQVGNVRTLHGSVSVVNGLLEAVNPSGNITLWFNNPNGNVSGRVYMAEYTIENFDGTQLNLDEMRTWSSTKRHFDITSTPFTSTIKAARVSVTLYSPMLYLRPDQGEIVRFSNIKFYELI